MDKPLNLNSLNMFVLVVRHTGFSGASRKVNIPVATLSRNVNELEAQLGVRLLERTTRHIRPTREGDVLYQFAARGLDEINAGRLALIDANEQLKGQLRLSYPGNLDFWWPLLREFQASYPNIALDIFTTERRIDLVADGIDVAVRIGDLKTQTAIARKVAEYRHVLVYAPAYAEKYGLPESPEQLVDFPCGGWSSEQNNVSWNIGGTDYTLKPQIQVNDFAHLTMLALSGDIITELPPFTAEPHLASGELLPLFPDRPLPRLSLNLLYPSRQYLSPLSRAYIDFALEYCERTALFQGL
ncbi:MAG: LysR family transcriptional regulator [Gammaproteobacteria bacterium]|nr:LysR family transcriptional regulator [Gammaproteobacteria bacterium]